MDKLNQVLLKPAIQVGADLFTWMQQGGTQGLAVALEAPQTLIQRIADADLRGMGGAGFPTARKWEAAAQAAGSEKYVVCNGNEDEPGTFKDRTLLSRTPHQVIEGALIAALAIRACHVIFYLNPHQQGSLREMRRAVAQWQDSPWLEKVAKAV